MLKLHQLHKSYTDGRPVLHDINYHLAQTEFVAVMGESGVGKSTLRNFLAAKCNAWQLRAL